jgi:hypothetical protein
MPLLHEGESFHATRLVASMIVDGWVSGQFDIEAV